jgi:glycosyltransferase involved in cell wall biosynthesis
MCKNGSPKTMNRNLVPAEQLVSVCIPTYNRQEKLKRAVTCLKNQKYGNFEILISDNASEDETENFCMLLQSNDTRVKYFRHNINIGPTANFEFVRAKACGKYFLWLADDDWLAPNYISECVSHLESDESLILTSGIAAYHRGDGTITHYGNIIQLLSRSSFFRIATYLWMVEENSIFCGLYRNELVKPCTFPNILAGDWAWLCNVALRGRARVLPQVYIYREFGDSSSASYERLVKIYGLAPWAARFPGIATALGIFKYLMKLKTWYGTGWKAVSCAYALGALVTLLVKTAYLNFREQLSKLPFARQIVPSFKKSLSK